MVIDFVAFAKTKKALEELEQAALEAEIARREHLEAFLSDILEELKAA
ncbi:MAG: hypothetical protein PHW76_09025 [Alphaproteobacteria bacterium]|nr:hypothetical protein [Alphaproteobacteria bacterium]